MRLHHLQIDRRRGRVIQLPIGTCGKYRITVLLSTLSAAHDATFPDDEANNDENESQTADENVWPTTQNHLFVPRSRHLDAILVSCEGLREHLLLLLLFFGYRRMLHF